MGADSRRLHLNFLATTPLRIRRTIWILPVNIWILWFSSVFKSPYLLISNSCFRTLKGAIVLFCIFWSLGTYPANFMNFYRSCYPNNRHNRNGVLSHVWEGPISTKLDLEMKPHHKILDTCFIHVTYLCIF